DGTVALWDSTTGKQLASLSSRGQIVSALAYNPDGNRLATANRDGSIVLWDVTNFQNAEIRRQWLSGQAHDDVVSSVVFHPTRMIAASGSFDHGVLLWDIMTGKHFVTLLGHDQSVNAIDFNSTGDLLASGGWDGAVN